MLVRVAVLAAVVLLLALPLSLLGSAAEVGKDGIVIRTPWARATPAGAKVGAAYLTIVNTGKAADRLLGGSLQSAGGIEVHETTVRDGVSRMRRLDSGLEVGAGRTVTLQPGGLHLMLVDLTGALKRGDRVKATLRFEKAGLIEVELEVAGIGASAPQEGHGAGGAHHH